MVPRTLHTLGVNLASKVCAFYTPVAPLGLSSVLILRAIHLSPLRGFHKSHISTSGAKGI